jgi:hypothetical protein
VCISVPTVSILEAGCSRALSRAYRSVAVLVILKGVVGACLG